MYRLLFIIPAIMMISGIEAQELQTDKKPDKFHVGLNYTFFQTGLELYSRTEHAIWQDLDYGTDTLSTDEIDWINSVAGFDSKNNALCVEAGMIFLDQPEGHWYIDGKILVGIDRTLYVAKNKNTGTTDLEILSSFSRPCTGLEFMFRYSFTSHWGLALNPLISFSWGSTKNITDNFDPPVLDLTETRKEKAASLYSRVSLLASYSVKGWTFSAGPGFYLVYNRRVYTVTRTNPETGSTFMNESNSVYYNSTFIDCCISIEWRIIPLLELSLHSGIGKDILVHPGIRFYF